MDQTSLGKVFTQLKHLPLNERIAAYYSYLKDSDRLPQVQRALVKSAINAAALKIAGDQCFLRLDFVEALKFYTRSVAAAPPGSTELAMAYAVRSVVLLKLDRKKACLVDVNRALKEDCPKTTRQKLRARKRELSVKIQENDREVLRLMRMFAKFDDLGEKGLRQELKHSEIEHSFDPSSLDLNYEHIFFLPEVNFKNNAIPVASEKVGIKYSPEFGRHVVALKDIKPGEVIAIEKPYSSIVSWEKAYNHCSNCFVKCEALISCPNCTEVLFCGKSCLKDASNRYHRIECQILLLSGYPVKTNLEWKVIRLLMIATKQGKELEYLMSHHVYKNPLQTTVDKVPDRFDSQDYMNIHNLPDHRDKRSDFDLWMAVHMTANLIYILKQTSFFKEQNNRNKFSLEEKEKYLGELLLKFVFLKSQNHEITEFHEWAMNSSKNDRMSVIGSGFYSFHGMFNHSCDPNVLKVFHKDTIVTYSSAPIKAGEQLFISYSKSFLLDARKDRQKFLLHNYFFTCKCAACEQNWPFLEDLESADSEMKTEELRRHAEEMLEYFGFGSIRNQHSSKPFNLLSDHLALLHENTTRPNLEYYKYQRDLYRMFCARGNYYSLECDGSMGSY